MASVYKKKNRPGWYLWYVDEHGDDHDTAINATTRAEANRFMREVEHAVERRKFGLDPMPVKSSMTVAQLCEWWLKDCCPKAGEKRERSRLGEHVLKTPLGKLQLHQADESHLEVQFAKMERAEAEPGSINRLRSTLGSVFSRAAKLKKWTGKNPIPLTTPRTVPKGVYITLKPGEIALVLRVLSKWWRDLFATAFYMALRKGELFALRKEDVNLEDREVIVQRSNDSNTTKGKKAVVLPIPPPLIPYMKSAMATPGRLLFPNAEGKQRKPTSKPEIVLRRAMARAGMVTGYRHTCRSCAAVKKPYTKEHQDGAIRTCQALRGKEVCGSRLWATPLPRKMKFHELRHSTATLLLRMGVPMAVVQRILRHAKIALTVELYGHLDIGDMREAMNRMPDAEEAAVEAAAKRAANFPDQPRTSAAAAEKTPSDPVMESSESEGLEWSGTPDSNRRPSPWQGTPRPVHLSPVEDNQGQSGHDRATGSQAEGHPGSPNHPPLPDGPRT